MLNDGLEAMFEGCIIDEIRQRESERGGGWRARREARARAAPDGRDGNPARMRVRRAAGCPSV